MIPDPNKQVRKPADLTFCPLEMLGAGEKLACELIYTLLNTLPIDRNRIYVTGHSMGGAGTWHMLYHRPGFFAAGVPVCGHPDPAMAATLRDVPIWNFHGTRTTSSRSPPRLQAIDSANKVSHAPATMAVSHCC